MKRGAERQLTKDDNAEDEEVRIDYCNAEPSLIAFQEYEFEPGQGLKKADEKVLAARPYVSLVLHVSF